MKYRTAINQILSLFIIASFTSCYELQSDEELREDIIGTWKKVDCKYPYKDGNDIQSESLLYTEMTFTAGGSYTEDGLYPYCCETQCDTAIQGPCRWGIVDGRLILVPYPYGFSNYGHLNRPYPILCLKGDRLVFDNLNISGVERTKTCYCRE